MFNRTALVILAAPLLALAACSAPQYANQAQHLGAPFTIAASVFASSSGPAQSFTFQAVFSDPVTGAPIDGPPIIRVGLCDGAGDGDPILTIISFIPNYTNGRFTADVPLPSTNDMLNIADPHICVLNGDGSDTPLIPRIPLQYAPFAWVAEHANSAGSAVSAQTATIADGLSNDGQVMLTFNSGWSDYGGAYESIKATRVGNMVFLSGLVQGNLIGSSITTLPVGFRPTERHICVTSAQGDVNRIDVSPTGDVFYTAGPGHGWLPLNGVYFPVSP